MNITDQLFNLRDEKYKDFHKKLIPNVDENKIIGIRTPALKDFAKSIKDSHDAKSFIQRLPHEYYEEYNLHVFLICEIKDFNACIMEVERILPYIDNWATCDSFKPKCFKRNKPKLLLKINEWIKSCHVYTVRFAIEMLMTHFLDDDFKLEYAELVASIKSSEYYLNMMIAWYFATALAKHYDETITFLHEKTLSVWVHNKTIQKAIESYRITTEQKQYLRNLKR